MSAKVSGFSFAVEVTPTLDTNAYAADDQLTDVMTIDTGIRDDSRHTGYILQSVTICDAAKQSVETVIFFFDESPTVASTKNAALDISDAEMADKCLGYATVTSYEDLSANSVGCARNVGLQLKVKSGGGNGKIYAVAKTNGAPTYAASSLVFKFHLTADL
jgi:hypothetical protein